MVQRVRAVFQNGVFVPLQEFRLPEGMEVEILVERPGVSPPEVSDPEERRRIIREMTERMRQNPIPPGAPRFTRDELHERR
ncbi:MAG TPA: antitoxin family protein [Blastocatellia bacterium]|nr:antitoxin family protein [Blastocatellia bacterium]